jgi:hypothetical protein
MRFLVRIGAAETKVYEILNYNHKKPNLTLWNCLLPMKRKNINEPKKAKQ